MKTSNITLKKTLLAATIASGVLFAGAVAQANNVITFNPGDATVGNGVAGVDIVNASGGLTGAGIKVDRLVWSAQAQNQNNGPNGFWGINISSTANGNGSHNFSESFTFVLQSAFLGGAGVAVFGDTNDNFPADSLVDSYVSVAVNVNGSITGAGYTALGTSGSNTATANALDLTYTSGSFAFNFHETGDISGTSSAMSTFNLLGGSSTTGSGPEKVLLGFELEMTNDPAGAFTDENGNAFAPLTDLIQTFSQSVQVSGLSGDSGSGFGVEVFSRGVATGFSIFPAVPEPSALAVFGIGLVGLSFAARRRKKKTGAV